MSIIGGIMGTSEPDFLNDPNYWGGVFAGARRTTSGEMVGGESALTLPTYWACVRNLSEDIAKMSVSLYRREGRTRYPADENRAHWLVHDEPNPEMSDFTFRETLTQWAAGWGNGYAEIQRDGRGNPVAMWPIHPGRVRVKRDKRTERLYYQVSAGDILSRIGVDAGGVRIEPDDMLHLRGMGSDVEGYSVFRAASESLGRSLAIQKFGAAFFGNGLNVNTVLIHPGELSDQALAHLRAQVSEEHSGASRAFRPFIAEEGMKLERISLPPEEAQALETGEFMVEDVCRWFRMPPHKVQHLKRATFSNIGSQAVEYVVDTLLSWVTRWDKELKRKLLPEAQRRTHFFKHNMETLLRGDPEARAKWIEAMIRNGVYTINDVLEIEDMNGAGPQGDQRLIPLNMTTAERMLNAGNDPQADVNFKREVVKALIADGTIGDVLFNLTDGKKLLEQVNIPIPAGTPEEPWLPVVAEPGPLVSGETITDPDGAIVGGDVEEPPEPESRRTGSRGAGPPKAPDTAEASAKLHRAGVRMLSAEMDRHIRKQAKAAPKAAEKHAGDAVGFTTWAEKFYAELSRDMAEGLTPLAEGLGDIAGCSASGTIVTAFVDGYTRAARTSVVAAFDEGAVALLVEGWNAGQAVDEAGKLAAAIVGGGG